MIQIKKTILTLVALLALTTGAWAADTYTVTFAANGNTKTVENVTLPKNFQCSYNNADGDLDLILKELYGWTGDSSETICANWSTPKSSDANKVVAGKNGNDHYITIDNVFEGTVTITGDYIVDLELTQYSLEISIAAPASSGPEVAWDKAEKTGTFTMPGGNVTLEPEYYPQATLAFQGLTAAEDAAAKTEAPLAVLSDGAVTGGTLMYYVATDKNFSQADAIALAETQWSAAIPTAETVDAAGTCYVWYYIKGDDEHSDTDPVPLAVTVLPEPTYAVTFAEGTDPNEWTASPNAGVTKGQTVTVTYTGAKKVIGVKAEKKAKAPSLSLTNPVVGQVIGSDGKNYAAANVPSGVDKVAMIAYVSGSNGLAIALADESSLNWTTAKSTCEAKTPAFTGGTWKLPTQDEWKNMFKAFGGNNAKYTGLNNALAAAGGNGSELQTGDSYWSSSEIDENKAYLLYLLSSDGDTDWYDDSDKNIPYRVRACLAF